MKLRTDLPKPVSTLLSFPFLQAIADLVPQSGRQWTADRSKLTADFSTRRRQRQFVAYTDDQMEDIFSRRILALIECKQSQRENHSPAVD